MTEEEIKPLYFDDKDDNKIEDEEIVEIMNKFEMFFTNVYNEKAIASWNENKQVLVDFEVLDAFDPDLASKLIEEPEEIIPIAEEALSNHPIIGEHLPKVRFYNLPSSCGMEIRDLRSENIGKFIYVEGIIRQASEVRPELTAVVFKCAAEGCGTRIVVPQTGIGEMIEKPRYCPSCQNRKLFDIVEKRMRDVQRLEIEELPERLGENPQPRKIGVFLRDDLVDPKFQKKIIPGRKVRVYGILKDMSLPRVKGETKRRELYIEGNYIESIEKEIEDVELNEEDIEKIKELAKDPDIYQKLVRSIAPSIYGYEHIKLAIALQLFGGVRKERKDGVVTRGDIHILLVGDPGAGKSQILKYVANLAPRARYVVGKSASGAGLTATVVRDDFIKGWALEAGALVLANKGIACIDELDKMGKEDRSAMHEVMEQQTVTVSKANVQATLLAQTTILAAANPKYGRFDIYASSLAEQIDLPETLLSRFDLIFPVMDKPDKDKDKKLVKHILKMHEEPEEMEPAIDIDLLRKYIAYARKNIRPKLTKAAEKMIEDFYVGLRSKGKSEETKAIPITTRQLEAIIRLSEASAKVRLSNKVTKKDVERAINLLKDFMMSLGVDPETGNFDIDRIETGMTTTQRNKMVILLKLIENLSKEYPEGIPVQDLIEIAKREGIEDAEVLIQKLHQRGEIYEPVHGFVKKT